MEIKVVSPYSPFLFYRSNEENKNYFSASNVNLYTSIILLTTDLSEKF